MLRTVTVTRYVTPLREGGSLPAIVEGDDLGLHVMKLRGAGQGVRALIAELVAGTLGQALGLKVPELTLLELDVALSRNEPDSEIRDLLKASAGTNVGLDFLPGSLTFDPVAGPPPSAQVASDTVWFDAFVTNVDRTARNPNLLVWHKALWLIDHGAALYFHHSWDDAAQKARSTFPAVKQHVLLPFATELRAAHERLLPRLTPAVLQAAVDTIPEAWLGVDVPFPDAAAHRRGYLDFLSRRVEAAPLFLEEALRARGDLV